MSLKKCTKLFNVCCFPKRLDVHVQFPTPHPGLPQHLQVSQNPADRLRYLHRFKTNGKL